MAKKGCGCGGKRAEDREAEYQRQQDLRAAYREKRSSGEPKVTNLGRKLANRRARAG